MGLYSVFLQSVVHVTSWTVCCCSVYFKRLMCCNMYCATYTCFFALQAPVSVPSRRHSTEGRHAVSMPPAPSAASLPASLSSRTASGGSASNAASSSSHGLRRLHRHSGSGSFLSAAANQLLSSLGMLSSLSLLSSSDGGGRSSSGGSSRGSPVRGRVSCRVIRQASLVQCVQQPAVKQQHAVAELRMQSYGAVSVPRRSLLLCVRALRLNRLQHKAGCGVAMYMLSNLDHHPILPSVLRAGSDVSQHMHMHGSQGGV